jgi:hypothetical protein
MRLIFFWALLSSTPTFSQIMKLPAETKMLIDGIEMKLILLRIYGTPTGGSFADLVIGFKNPETEEWSYFDSPRIPFQNQSMIKFFRSSPLNVIEKYRSHNLDFLDAILERKGKEFLWKCECREIDDIVM